MPFGLKNVGATYQRLVNRMFASQIGRNMEVYVDDMLTKSVTINKHVDDLRETFDVLTKYGMKLNPTKCVFGVPADKFLRFISKSADKCLPFFRALKKGKGVKWNEDCEQAFHALKDYLGRAPLLSKPLVGETLYINMSITGVATSSVLVRQENGIQKPVYYTSKALLLVETRYSPAELTKWVIELSEFDIRYLLRTSIKGEAIANFVVEFTEPNVEAAKMMVEQIKKNFQWKLHVDGSSNTHGSGAEIVVLTPEGDSVEYALCFDFKATNNQAEYEALIAGLRVCTALRADEIEIFSDSQVIVNQVLDEYQVRDESMITYLELTKGLLG
ncbi:hypothetical protein Q3G72_002259 [Acer saccharum]|nr:hypothetical protein Q3G72_002259 [Acer saccharum]